MKVSLYSHPVALILTAFTMTITACTLPPQDNFPTSPNTLEPSAGDNHQRPIQRLANGLLIY